MYDESSRGPKATIIGFKELINIYRKTLYMWLRGENWGLEIDKDYAQS
jgi:hypothetical protein